MDPKQQLEDAKQRLTDNAFFVEKELLDETHFGNWRLIALRGSLAVRLTGDRGDVLLDLMPSRLFEAGADIEENWYTWDVVKRALGLKAKSLDPLKSFLFHAHYLEFAFSPIEFKSVQHALRETEEKKRLRFMRGHLGRRKLRS